MDPAAAPGPSWAITPVAPGTNLQLVQLSLLEFVERASLFDLDLLGGQLCLRRLVDDLQALVFQIVANLELVRLIGRNLRIQLGNQPLLFQFQVTVGMQRGFLVIRSDQRGADFLS